MQTWLDLEKRFRLLTSKLKDTRLDEQSGHAGEYWRLAGGYSSSSHNEFELLSSLAGNLLREVGHHKAELREITNHQDSKICWYRALKKFSNSCSPRFYAVQKDKKGDDSVIVISSIHDLAENSANVCLFLEVHYPLTTKFYIKLWNDYGKQIAIGIIIAVILAILRLS